MEETLTALYQLKVAKLVPIFTADVMSPHRIISYN